MAEQPDKDGHKTGGRWPSWRDHALFWAVVGGGLGLDLWTKVAIFRRLGPADSIQVVPGCVRLIRALNDGAAFSLASGRQPVLVAISAVALVGILVFFVVGGRKPALTTVALGLFAGGVLGNLWDRLFNQGLVRDFIDVYVGRRHWPTFNVADMLLCAAVGLLLFETVVAQRYGRRRRP